MNDRCSHFLRSSLLFVLLAVLSLVLLAPLPGHAQLDQGAITGTVQDQSGAIVSGAEVTLTSTDTGLVLQTKSDARGIFTFSPIKIGNYRVSAKAAGFAVTTQQHVHVDVQARVSVTLTLQPGVVTQSVQVTTAPPMLQTQSGSVGQVMSTETINNIPLNGRNAMYVAQLAAGVVQGVGGRGLGTGDFTANGQRPTQNNFILDGIDNNTAVPDFLNGSSFVVNPPPDALAEFNIQTNSYSAEFGHSAGAVMNESMKAGTNQFHGSLWEYLRNTDLDAKDFNAKSIPTYHENQFGATLGAPILKNRLFFFGYAEANRIVFGETYTQSVPTAAMRTGDFSELLNPSLTEEGAPVTLYAPDQPGTPPISCNGQKNVICPSQANPVALGLLKLYPMPNTNGGKLFNNYVVTTNAVSNTWQWGTRFDWNISPRDQAFVRFIYWNSPSHYPSPLGPILDGGSYGFDGNITNQADNFAFSETHLFSPTLINEIRFGYNYGNFSFKQAEYSNTGLAASLGLGGIPTGLGGGLPLTTLTGLGTFGQPGYYPNHKAEDVYQILDNLTKIMGNHALKFGVQFQSARFPFFSPPNGRGTYGYSGFFTSKPGQSNTGYGPADMVLDKMNSATVPTFQSLDFSHWTRSAYFEDDWRVTPRLTLNLGLRYDYFQAVKEVSGKFASFEMTSNGPGTGKAVLVYAKSQQQAVLAPKFLNLLAANNVPITYSDNPFLVNMQKLNFGPRLGFAFSLNDKTVVHGGYGIFYGGIENTGGPETMQNYPFQFTANFPRPSCKPGDCPTNGITLANGFAAYISGPGGLIDQISTPSFTGSQPNVKTPYTQSYNLSVQRSLSNNLVATVSYVGDVSRHLVSQINLNSPSALVPASQSTTTVQPFPAFGSAGTNVYGGVSSYNSLQAKMEKRFSAGLSFLATYTWAHSLDDAGQPLSGNQYRAVNMIGIGNDYTNSIADARHRVTFNGFYELPFGQGQRFLSHGRLLGAIAGGWAADMQFSAQTGFPFTVGTNLGSAGPNGGSANAILVGNPFRAGGSPNPTNPKISCAASTRNKQHWYNPCAFANPPVTGTGTYTGLAALPFLGGRYDQIHGPGYARLNSSIFKRFTTFHEQFLELRADIFNVLNTPAYGNPSTTSNSSTGGAITSPRTFQNFTPDARFFQISAKYVF